MKKYSLLVFLLGLTVYFPSFYAPFQFDDYLTIVVNPVVQNLSRIDHLWMYDPSRFLTHLTFAFNFYFGKLDPFGYHVINFIVHIVNVFLVWVLTVRVFDKGGLEKKERGWGRVLPAFIFLLHPIQTSAVTYVAQRSTLLAVSFYLLTIILFWTYREKGKKSFYILSLLTVLIGCFCKPIMISVPFALILVDVYFLKRDTRRWISFVPHLLIVMIIPVLLAFWRHNTITFSGILSMTREADVLTRPQYLFTQFHVLWEYIRLIVLPVEQNLDYDFPIYATFLNAKTVAAFTGLLALFSFGIFSFKKHRLVSFCILWFFLTLALESSVFPIKDVIFEHRLYLPMVGVSLLITILIGYVKDQKLVNGMILGLLIVYCGLSLHRNFIWSDRIAFLEDAARKSPKKMRVLNGLAIAYAEAGQYGNAVFEMKRILHLNPNDMQTVGNLANTFRNMGRYEEAIKYYNINIQAAPNHGAAYYFRSQCYHKLKNIKQARWDVKRAQELGYPYIDPRYWDALSLDQ